MARDQIVGPDSGPVAPFPIKLGGRIVKGFGRGSKDLGIPTANLPLSGLKVGGHDDIESGVYFGWAGISLKSTVDESQASGPPKPEESTSVTERLNEALGKVKGAVSGHRDPSDTISDEPKVYPMVASIGYNPFYNNTVRSIEVHVMEKFDKDFYNASMNVTILGFIRPEQGYDTMQALIDDINMDIEVTRNSLDRPAYEEHKSDPYLVDFSNIDSK